MKYRRQKAVRYLRRGRYCGDEKSSQRKEQSDKKTDSTGNHLESSFLTCLWPLKNNGRQNLWTYQEGSPRRDNTKAAVRKDIRRCFCFNILPRNVVDVDKLAVLPCQLVRESNSFDCEVAFIGIHCFQHLQYILEETF